MSVVYAQDAALFIALLVSALSLLIWVVLRSKRSPGVNAWCSAALLGAAFLVFNVLVAERGLLPRVVEFAILGSLGVASFVLKALALMQVDGAAAPARPVIRLLLLNLGVLVLLSWAPVDRNVPSTFVVGAMMLGLAATIVAAARLARRLRLWNARLLAISLLIPGLASLGLFLIHVIAGVDPLRTGNEATPLLGIVVTAIFALFNNGLFIGVVNDVAARRERATEAAVATIRLDRSRLEERERMVADLHDGFGSQLTSARIRAERHQLSAEEMREILQDCLSDLHLVVDGLQNTEGRVANALRFLRHRMAGRLAVAPARLHWELQVDDELHLPPSSLLHLLRIIQEAVNNALKHAQARNIHVSAVQSDGTLTVAVRDDGRGLPAQLAEGSGMRNMRNRAQRLGAELRLESTATGTRISLVLRPGTGGLGN